MCGVATGRHANHREIKKNGIGQIEIVVFIRIIVVYFIDDKTRDLEQKRPRVS